MLNLPTPLQKVTGDPSHKFQIPSCHRPATPAAFQLSHAGRHHRALAPHSVPNVNRKKPGGCLESVFLLIFTSLLPLGKREFRCKREGKKKKWCNICTYQLITCLGIWNDLTRPKDLTTRLQTDTSDWKETFSAAPFPKDPWSSWVPVLPPNNWWWVTWVPGNHSGEKEEVKNISNVIYRRERVTVVGHYVNVCLGVFP